jgi:hypothetical protein
LIVARPVLGKTLATRIITPKWPVRLSGPEHLHQTMQNAQRT